MSISAKDILDVTKGVTKKWTKQRKAEERGRSRRTRANVYSDRVNFTDVADKILPDAYQHASGGGQYPVAKRQLYYASREQFREWTGREIKYAYFANTLLVQFLNSRRHSHITDGWRITADPRGTIVIPSHRGLERIPCGTLQVDNYLSRHVHSKQVTNAGDFDSDVETRLTMLSPHTRLQGVLYIEKEGFGPILEQANIAERFDIAIVSCKGQSVVAARKMVDHVCYQNGGIPLFVVHDLDKAGFEISQRLTKVSQFARQNDRVTYEFRNQIQAHDLGLRLADVHEYNLDSEQCDFKGRFAKDSICTDEEREFLRGGERVELNAMTSPQLVEWLEARLGDYITERLIPDVDFLKDAYRRALAVARVNWEMEAIREAAIEAAEKSEVPTDLRQQLKDRLSTDDPKAWDDALYDIAHEAYEDGLSEGKSKVSPSDDN